MRYAVTFTNEDGEYVIAQSGFKMTLTECLNNFSHIPGVELKYFGKRRAYSRVVAHVSVRDMIEQEVEKRLSSPGKISAHEIVEATCFSHGSVMAVMREYMRDMVRYGRAQKLCRGTWKITKPIKQIA